MTNGSGSPVRDAQRRRFAVPIGIALALGLMALAIWRTMATDVGRRVASGLPTAYRWVWSLPRPLGMLLIGLTAVAVVLVGFLLIRTVVARAREYVDRI